MNIEIYKKRRKDPIELTSAYVSSGVPRGLSQSCAAPFGAVVLNAYLGEPDYEKNQNRPYDDMQRLCLSMSPTEARKLASDLLIKAEHCERMIQENKQLV